MKKVFFILTLQIALTLQTVNAAVFNIANGDVAALIAAINTANTNGEADIINLAAGGVYTLTAVNYTSANPGTSGYEGQRGLPRIREDVAGLDVTINGNGATIIRSLTAPNFGLMSVGAQVIINDLTFRNGKVNAQGAAIMAMFKSNLTVNNCFFYDNESLIDVEGGGGAIYTKSLSELVVQNCYFENNKAVNQGGAISNLLSNMSVINSTFKNNSITDIANTDTNGGAIYDDGAKGDNGFLIVRNCLFEGNNAAKGQGGGLFLFPYNLNTAEVTNCTFKNNSANQGGGFWHSGGSLVLNDPTGPFHFTNTGENTQLLMHSCTFEGNNATSLGGGFWLNRGIISDIYDCVFKNNTAYNGSTDGQGGAIYLFTNRPVTIRNSSFYNNNSRIGGGIAFGNESTVQVTNCTFDNNIAHALGGAASVPSNNAAKAVTFTNCTFANNQANEPSYGHSGAIFSLGSATSNSSVTVKNCIFHNHSVTTPGNGINCRMTLVDGGNNLFFPENTNAFTCVSSPVVADPLLLPLADNGGPTPTMALQAESPAIDAGSGCPSTDQRGANRVGVCDIGAFEFGGIVTSLSENNEILKRKLIVFPNPSSLGKVSIIVPEEMIGKNVIIRMINLHGQEVINKNYKIMKAEFKLNFGTHLKGIFVLTIQSEQYQYQSKIILGEK